MNMRILLIVLTAVLLSACSPKTAATGVNSTLAPTAQADQYRRDAEATVDARELSIQQAQIQIALTASEATAISERASATAQRKATAEVTETAAYWSTDTAQRAINAIATSEKSVQLTETSVYSQTIATQTAMPLQTQTAIDLTKKQNEADRERVTNYALTALLIIVLCVAIYLLFLWFRTQNRNSAKAGSVVRYGVGNSNALIFADNGEGETLINPLTNTAAITTLNGQGGVFANELSPDVRLQALLAMYHVLLQQAQHTPFAPVAPTPATTDKWKIGPVEHATSSGALPSAPRAALQKPAAPQPALLKSAEVNPPLAWPTATPFGDYMRQWSPGRWAIGASTAGLLSADLRVDPHLLISGTTGSGKTYLLRTIIAGALASGLQVIAVGLPRPGLKLFESHPNFRVIHLDPLHPEQAPAYLMAAYGEINRRNILMYQHNADNWETLTTAAAPRMLWVFDELSNLAEAAIENGLTRDEFWRPARLVAREGRKASVHLAVGLQDPNEKYCDLSLRRNAIPVALKLRDASISRVAIGIAGAETLAPRQMLCQINGLQHGMTLDADDRSITDWLGSHMTPVTQPASWIQLPEAKLTEAAITNEATVGDAIEALAETIRPAWERQDSKRAMARVAGREYAGSFAGRLDRAIAYLENASPATTTAK